MVTQLSLFVLTKDTGFDNQIRTYHGVHLQNVDIVYIVDQRAVIEIPFGGKGEKYTNAEEWDSFNGRSVNDKVFMEYFSQYNVKCVREEKLIHYHIGGGGQVFSLSQKLTTKLR
ncbi:hypothetical protein [Bacillus cereus group sp. BfR-BA-01428]|uniref:hypothetical protein n=1 Tax=Bacillus cereus group sp. BfR-BA-01428 TaxID=2920345 RepID=UPI001F5AAD2D